MSLREKFAKFMDEYADVYETVKKTQNFKHPFGSFIRQDIVNEIMPFIDKKNYSVKGSCGAGRYTTVPWIAVFDKRITTSAQKGVYIVYLLNKDTKELFLTLNQGATDISQDGAAEKDGKLAFTGIAGSSNAKSLIKLKEKAQEIRNAVGDVPFDIDEEIKCGASNYDAGAVCYKKYTLDNLPDDNQLLNDLREFINIYARYAERHLKNATQKDNDSWWPSQEEYPLNLTKEDWRKYILEIELPNYPSPMKMLKGMMELGNEASCKQLSDTYGGHPSAYAGCAMNLGRRVKKYFDFPACMDGGKERYFPFPFVGKYRGGSEDNYIYKIRPQLLSALKEIDLSSISPYYEEEHKHGKFDSWEIINETTAIKTCDKSFFEYKGSGVPKEICWFFDAENIPKGSSKPINLLFGGNSGKNYKGVLKNDSTDRRRIQIRWNSDLGQLFEQFKDLNAKAKFVKTDVDTYEIYMCVEKDDAEKDAWLLAWNPNSWEWEDLKEACELTRNGNVYNITWSCASNSVKVGDRVYIIVLGTTENGIIASGHAISEQYEYEHWDEQKRADGKKNKGIDIELEYIIDPKSNAPLAQSFLKTNFPEQHWSPQASGISIKEQYVNDLYEEWLKHVSKIQGGEKEMTTKERINTIKSYIAARGFNYEGDLIENFYLSIKSKPFVILAGTSGTGKTRLVKLFAEAIGAEMQLVPVRPDWSDSSDLFGHLDLNGDFIKGAIIDFVKDASDHLTKPYFLCFDEMNLARVEHYMSDILSVIETRDFDENKKRIITSPLIEKDFCRCSNGRNEYGELRIPENLYIIGTVNMDETTFPFSKKVLDRANTIEFSFVDLMSKPVRFEALPQKLNEDNSFLKTEYLYLLDCDDNEVIDTVCFNLEELNQILVKANLHVGYRVRDEILFYMMNNKKAGLLSEEAAFDHEIMQKILPRVQGSSAAIKDVLSELFVKCAGDFSGFSGGSTFEQMNTYIDQKDCKYTNSAKKIAFMMRRYEEDGFTSYWL